MPVIKAVIEYDGTDFCGFQRQPALRTVQGELERSLGRIFREPRVPVIGCGRTDAGVHATGQVVSFTAPESFPVEKICLAANSDLPIDIRVKRAGTAPDRSRQVLGEVENLQICCFEWRDALGTPCQVYLGISGTRWIWTRCGVRRTSS